MCMYVKSVAGGGGGAGNSAGQTLGVTLLDM